MTKSLEMDLTPILEVLRRDGGYLRSRDIGTMLGIDPRYIGFNLARAAALGLVDVIPKTNNAAAQYRARPDAEMPKPAHDWFRGWRNPETGVTAPRLG